MTLVGLWNNIQEIVTTQSSDQYIWEILLIINEAVRLIFDSKNNDFLRTIHFVAFGKNSNIVPRI